MIQLMHIIIFFCREILEDSNFQQALQRIIEEPIPYFSQISTHVLERYSNVNSQAPIQSQLCSYYNDKITVSTKRNDSLSTKSKPEEKLDTTEENGIDIDFQSEISNEVLPAMR